MDIAAGRPPVTEEHIVTDPILEGLNPPQLAAVTHGKGPLLIISGPGAGKTRVMTHRIAYLLREQRATPEQIIAVTFTNKAAKEMQKRVIALVGPAAESMWISTFHSICAKILRKYGCPNGVTEKFSIYDEDDQAALMKKVLAGLNIAEQFTPKIVLEAISKAKNALQTTDDLRANTDATPEKLLIAEAYTGYEQALIACNALDFDDLIMQAVLLLKTNYMARDYYQQRFHYVLTDEFQDVNHAQLKLITLIGNKWNNINVVGDDSQSVYSWRGADMGLILSFNTLFPDVTTIKLEQNYRSTPHILRAASQLMLQNTQRIDKTLWTEKTRGELLYHIKLGSEHDEGAFIVKQLQRYVKDAGGKYSDCAILYRINALSRSIEQALVKANIPYKIVGGTKFFGRKEVRDIVAYLKVLYNPADRMALKRIINTPTRGISDKTFQTLEDFAKEHNATFQAAMEKADYSGISAKAAAAVHNFQALLTQCLAQVNTLSLDALIEYVINAVGYKALLEKEGGEVGSQRLGNVEELKSVAVALEQGEDVATLGDFLERVGLMMDTEEDEASDDVVTLMTMHASKGSEYPCIFLAGMEEGIFPSGRALCESDESLEEERRLCYVAITRAMKRLYCLSVSNRMLYGKPQKMPVSRFMAEINPDLIKTVTLASTTPSYGYRGNW